MQAGAIVSVWRTVAREYEWEVNDFYEQEHMEHVVGIDGFLAGYRFYNTQGTLPFMILYEAVDETVEAAPGFQNLVKEPGPRAVSVGKLPGTKTKRVNFAVREDTGGRGSPGGLIALSSSDGPGGSATAALRDSMPGCLRYRALQSASDSNIWLEIWDFRDLAGAKSAIGNVPVRQGALMETYAATGTPWIKTRSGASKMTGSQGQATN